MHRTEGPDFDPDGNGVGKRGYVDATPPSIPATILSAEAMNAIQEEICYLIEQAGITLHSGESSDRLLGWTQLYEAIFQQNHGDTQMLQENNVNGDRLKDLTVLDGKIATLNFAKIFGELTQSQVVGSVTEAMEIKFDQVLLRYTHSGGTISETTMHQTDGFLNAKHQSNNNEYQCQLNAYGLGFWGEKQIAWKQVDLSSANFTDTLDRSIAYIDTEVPITEWDGIDASFSYEDLDAPGVGSYSAPNQYSLALKWGPTRFTAPIGSLTWIAVVVFGDDAFYTDGDTNYINKKVKFTFRKV